MINFAIAMVGHFWHGGLGLAGVVACALFAAVSGSSPATVVAIGSDFAASDDQGGFPNRFGAGIITTSGALGILVPPSIVMVMYSVATSTSVGALFIVHRAGLGTGNHVRRHHLVSGAEQRLSSSAAHELEGTRQGFHDSVWGLLLIVVVIGGIYTGIFTATEVAMRYTRSSLLFSCIAIS